MMYPLRPVLEDIQKTAEEEGDTRIMKMCQCILKAMHNRPEDNYVSYRKVSALFMYLRQTFCTHLGAITSSYWCFSFCIYLTFSYLFGMWESGAGSGMQQRGRLW